MPYSELCPKVAKLQICTGPQTAHKMIEILASCVLIYDLLTYVPSKFELIPFTVSHEQVTNVPPASRSQVQCFFLYGAMGLLLQSWRVSHLTKYL